MEMEDVFINKQNVSVIPNVLHEKLIQGQIKEKISLNFLGIMHFSNSPRPIDS